jgi:hypothetical protein
MKGAGHSWTVSTAVTFSLSNLLAFDAIFLAGDGADNSVLTAYVNAGGNVYLAGGTGVVGTGLAADEAAQWNPFLNVFGLNFGTSYNGLIGTPTTPTITSTHPIFSDVKKLYWNNGNSVNELVPTELNTDILQVFGGHGLYGVFSPN